MILYFNLYGTDLNLYLLFLLAFITFYSFLQVNPLFLIFFLVLLFIFHFCPFYQIIYLSYFLIFWITNQIKNDAQHYKTLSFFVNIHQTSLYSFDQIQSVEQTNKEVAYMEYYFNQTYFHHFLIEDQHFLVLKQEVYFQYYFSYNCLQNYFVHKVT